jgi:hypothetical protein
MAQWTMLENLHASSRKRTNQEARRKQKNKKREKGTGKKQEQWYQTYYRSQISLREEVGEESDASTTQSFLQTIRATRSLFSNRGSPFTEPNSTIRQPMESHCNDLSSGTGIKPFRSP